MTLALVEDTTVGELMPTEDDVRKSITSARKHLERAAEEIVWQVENQVWTVLGYGSWDEMREAEYGGAACMVPTGSRPRITARLRSHLTQQQTADTLGVSERQIRRDDSSTGQLSGSDTPATVTNTRGQERPSTYKKSGKSSEPKRDGSETESVDYLNDISQFLRAMVKHPKTAAIGDKGRKHIIGELQATITELSGRGDSDDEPVHERAKRPGSHKRRGPAGSVSNIWHRRIVERFVEHREGQRMVLGYITEIDGSISPDEAEKWAGMLEGQIHEEQRVLELLEGVYS